MFGSRKVIEIFEREGDFECQNFERIVWNSGIPRGMGGFK